MTKVSERHRGRSLRRNEQVFPFDRPLLNRNLVGGLRKPPYDGLCDKQQFLEFRAKAGKRKNQNRWKTIVEIIDRLMT